MTYTVVEAPDGIDILYNGSIYHFETMPEDVRTTLEILEREANEVTSLVEASQTPQVEPETQVISEVIEEQVLPEVTEEI